MQKRSKTSYQALHANSPGGGGINIVFPFLAFIIPALIIGVAFACMEVSPFGDNSMMVIDNFHQYSPFLSEFKDILKDGGSLLYSWNSGMGTNYWARYGYYLASPLNFLFRFFPQEFLPEFIVLLTLIRTGVAGLCFYLYLKAKFYRDDITAVAFAAMFAVSSFTLAYYWNIMWFDSIAVLPLIVLGLERLIRDGKGILYCISLAYAMYTNYYIALIMCIFIVVYYFVYYFSLQPKPAKTFGVAYTKRTGVADKADEGTGVADKEDEVSTAGGRTVVAAHDANEASVASKRRSSATGEAADHTVNVETGDGAVESDSLDNLDKVARMSSFDGIGRFGRFGSSNRSGSVVDGDSIENSACDDSIDTVDGIDSVEGIDNVDSFGSVDSFSGTDNAKGIQGTARRSRRSVSISGCSNRNTRDSGLSAFLKKSILFGCYSILAAGLAAIILLPTYEALSVSQSAGATFPQTISTYFNMLEILSGHLMNVEPSVMSGMPNIYCSVAVLILVPLYALNRKFKTREKICNLSLIAFFLLSCNINYLNFIWHGFHFPNSLPYRFTFLYCFFIVMLAYKAFINLDGVKRSTIFTVLTSAIAVVIILETLNPNLSQTRVIYPSMLFLVLTGIALSLVRTSAAPSPKTKRHKANRIHSASESTLAGASLLRTTLDRATTTPAHSEPVSKQMKRKIQLDPTALFPALKPLHFKHGFAEVFMIVVIVELTINAIYGIPAAGVGQRNNYMQTLTEVKEAVAEVKSWGGENDFYRMEFLKDTVSNTPSLYNYKGASYFSSTAVVSFTDLMEKLGLRPSSAWYIYKGSTPIINSLFSFRYLLSKESHYDHPLYPLVDTINDIRVYKNPYQLPLGFVVSDRVKNWSINSTNVFAIQNDFIQKSTDSDSLALIPVTYSTKSITNAEITEQNGASYKFRVLDSSQPGFINFDFMNPDNKPLYIYIRSREVDYVWYIKQNGSEGHNIKYYPYIIDTQYIEAAETVEVSLKFEENFSGTFEVHGCLFDEAAYAEAFNILSSNPMTITSFKDTKVTGTVTTDRRSVLFTTIPYDKGWSVKLNGKQVPLEDIHDGFICVSLEAGNHEVEFSYMPPGFIFGLILSLASLGIIILLIVTDRKEKALA